MSEEAIARSPETRKPGRAKLQRSRGARIVEGRASGLPEPTPPSAGGRPRGGRADLPPIPGADVVPERLPRARKRVARSPAGSARSEPVPTRRTPRCNRRRSCAARSPSRLRAGRGPPPPEGERPAPVRMELRRSEPAPQSVAGAAAHAARRPRWQPSQAGPSAPAPVADIVVPPPAEARRVPPRDRRADRPRPGVGRDQRRGDAGAGRGGPDSAAPRPPRSAARRRPRRRRRP